MFVPFSLALCTLTLLSSGVFLALLTTIIALLSAVSPGDSSILLREADNYKWSKNRPHCLGLHVSEYEELLSDQPVAAGDRFAVWH